MTTPKSTVVLVHGGWHSPEHYAPLEAELQSHGYKTNSVWLPTMHYARLSPPLEPAKVSLLDDVRAVQSAIRSELSANPRADVMVVAHSYGSTPASAALEQLDKPTRAKAGHQNGVAGLLIMSGLIIDAGITPLEWAGNQVPPTVTLSTMPDPRDSTKEITISNAVADPGPVALFYHDVPNEEARRKWADLCTHQLWTANTEKVPFAGWKVPGLQVYYLVCEEDRALPAAFQRIMIDTADQAVAALEGAGRQEDESSGGEGRASLKKFQNDSIAGIAASKAIIEDIKTGKAGQGAAGQESAVQNESAAGGQAKTGARKIHVTSIKSAHSPFLSKVEETAQWIRKCGGEVF